MKYDSNIISTIVLPGIILDTYLFTVRVFNNWLFYTNQSDQ